jgi:hypothetical protein
VVNHIVVGINDFAPWTIKLQFLENLFYLSVHLFWRISRQALRLNTRPNVLRGNTDLTVETVTTLALEWVGLHYICAESTDEKVNSRSQWRINTLS